MRYTVESAGNPTTVYTEEGGMARIHVEGQPETSDLVMTSQQFDAFLGHATETRKRPVGALGSTSVGNG